MKNRGRSPAGAKASALRSGTGSSGHSLASDHEHEEAAVGAAATISTYPSGGPTGLGALAAVTSTLAAATAEETSLTLPANMSASSSVSPSHHVRHHSNTLPFAGSHYDSHDSFSLGNSIFYDDPEVIAQLSATGTPDPALTQKAIEHYQSKIGKTKELIKEVQTSLDENVNEYLKLSANATDGVQQQRIKQVFEKKNQKSAQQIAQLQRKLDEYNRKVRDLEKHGLQKPKIRDIGQNLKNVGGTIRDGISGMSNTVMSRPKEFANFVLRGAGGHHKFGSADNLSATMSPSNPEGSKGSESSSKLNSSEKTTVKPNSLPREGSAGGTSSLLSNENRQSSFEERRKCLSEDGGLRHRSSRPSDATSSSSIPPPGTKSQSSSHGQQIAQQQQNVPTSSPSRRPNNFGEDGGGEDAGGGVSDGEWNAIIQELTLHKEEVDRLREEMEELRQQCKQDVEGNFFFTYCSLLIFISHTVFPRIVFSLV